MLLWLVSGDTDPSGTRNSSAGVWSVGNGADRSGGAGGVHRRGGVTCGVVGVVVADSRDTGPVATNPTGEPECAVDRGVLPEWARAGFSEREPEIAHVVGLRGELAAILFGDPLTARRRPDPLEQDPLGSRGARRSPGRCG